MLHKITLSGYEARLASGSACGAALTLGTAGSYGVEQLLVTAAEDWQELSIRASFQPAGVRILISPGQVAEVPWEATQAPLPYPKGRIVFQGFAEGKLVNTCDLPYSVAAHSAAGEQAPQPPTPDEYEQFVQQVQADADRAEAAAGQAAQSAGRAEDAASQASKAAGDAKDTLGVIEETASKALTDIESGKHTALESITHQKEDALAAVDQSKTDATGDVQTAKQEAVAAITHTGAAQTQAVTQAGEQAVQEVDSAAQAGVGSVGQAQQTATQAVQTTATAAIQRVAQTGGTQVQAIVAAGAEQIKGIETTAAEKLEGITQLAGQAADSATQAVQAAQRAEDAAAATNAIIDDTAITPDKTWSSKGIVDVLCPPIQATGNPVVCYPVPGYPLGVTVDFAPIQEGAGDPSPENVRPIKGRDSVQVERCGENLLNPTKNGYITYTPYGLEITYLGDNRVHLKGTYQEDGGSFVILDTQQKLLAGKGLKITGFTIEGTKQNFTLYGLRTKDETVITMQAEFRVGDVIDMIVAVVVSDTPHPTTFAPYTGQTTTLTLPTPCYGGKLDAVTGEGQETWHTIVLTGQESSHIFDKFFYLNIGNNPKPKDLTSGRSSHYKYATYGKGCIGVPKNGVSAVLGAEGQFPIDEAGLNAWKSYLAAQYAAGTPVQIAYKVATPTPITATGGKPIPALAGVNTVLTDGDSLTVTGRADIVHALAEMSRSVTQNAQVVDAMLGINPKRLD